MFHHLFLPEETATPWPSKDSVTAGPTRRPPWDSMWPMQGEAEAMLAEYRSKAARLFPFIVLPEIKASELKEQRPFLWKAVMIVACFLDGARHDRLGEELINEIVTATMMKTERSLDILQGLQLLVAWYVRFRFRETTWRLLTRYGYGQVPHEELTIDEPALSGAIHVSRIGPQQQQHAQPLGCPYAEPRCPTGLRRHILRQYAVRILMEAVAMRTAR